MPPVSAWLALMPQTVTHASVTSRDVYGLPVYGPAISYRARVSHKATRVTNRMTGQDAIATGEVWIAGVPTVTIEDKITLPDGTSPPILTWDQPPDEHGPHHTKIFFGGTNAGIARGQ